MTTILSANGLIEIPEAYRKADALKAGQRCEIERVAQGEYRVRVAENAGSPGLNWVEWLLSCPEKDWFVEPERNEMTSLEPPAHFAE